MLFFCSFGFFATFLIAPHFTTCHTPEGGTEKSLIPALFLCIFCTIFSFFFAWLTRITAIHQPPRFPSIIKPEIIYTSDFVFFPESCPLIMGKRIHWRLISDCLKSFSFILRGNKKKFAKLISKSPKGGPLPNIQKLFLSFFFASIHNLSQIPSLNAWFRALTVQWPGFPLIPLEIAFEIRPTCLTFPQRFLKTKRATKNGLPACTQEEGGGGGEGTESLRWPLLRLVVHTQVGRREGNRNNTICIANAQMHNMSGKI